MLTLSLFRMTSRGAQKQTDNTGLKKEEKQRILGIVPARNLVLSGQAPPLTKAQKFGLFTKGSIDPFAFFGGGASLQA